MVGFGVGSNPVCHAIVNGDSESSETYQCTEWSLKAGTRLIELSHVLAPIQPYGMHELSL
jgi:hypothetical protein